jgi:hypothetical protein
MQLNQQDPKKAKKQKIEEAWIYTEYAWDEDRYENFDLDDDFELTPQKD